MIISLIVGRMIQVTFLPGEGFTPMLGPHSCQCSQTWQIIYQIRALAGEEGHQQIHQDARRFCLRLRKKVGISKSSGS